MNRRVAVVMGSASDQQIARDAVSTLKEYGVPCTVRVLSAHRTPGETQAFAASLRLEGYGAVIAFAGMAAHLAGALAANTTLPVIGVPVASGSLNGMDAVLSTLQMPPGIPVACVGVNGARNAALLAVQMLAIHDPDLEAKLACGRAAMREKALDADRAIQEDWKE